MYVDIEINKKSINCGPSTMFKDVKYFRTQLPMSYVKIILKTIYDFNSYQAILSTSLIAPNDLIYS